MMSESRPKPWLLTSFLLGVVLQFLAALPAALYQTGAELENLAALPIAVPVLTGGRTVVQIFEETVRAVCGDRRDTMLDNAWWFLTISATQTGLIALLLAWRRRRTGSFRDRIAVGLLIFVFVNAALAVNWPWWGT